MENENSEKLKEIWENCDKIKALIRYIIKIRELSVKEVSSPISKGKEDVSYNVNIINKNIKEMKLAKGNFRTIEEVYEMAMDVVAHLSKFLDKADLIKKIILNAEAKFGKALQRPKELDEFLGRK